MKRAFHLAQRAHLKRGCVGPECVPGAVPGPMSEGHANTVHGSRRGSFPRLVPALPARSPVGWMDCSHPWVRTQGGCTKRLSATRGRPREVLPINKKGRRNPRQLIKIIGIILLKRQPLDNFSPCEIGPFLGSLSTTRCCVLGATILQYMGGDSRLLLLHGQKCEPAYQARRGNLQAWSRTRSVLKSSRAKSGDLTVSDANRRNNK
jgi:hypothetical protein